MPELHPAVVATALRSWQLLVWDDRLGYEHTRGTADQVRRALDGGHRNALQDKVYNVSQPTVSRIVAQHRRASEEILAAGMARHPAPRRPRLGDSQGQQP